MKTLEEILQELGSQKPFLNKPTVNADGSCELFTKKGNEVYSKLVEILYAVGDLTKIDMNEAIERLDDIANEMY